MRYLACFLAALLAAQTPDSSGTASFSSTTNLIVVDVTVLDKDGRPVENLTAADFILLEDGKPQILQSVDLQKLSMQPLGPAAPVLHAPPPRTPESTAVVTPPITTPDVRDHRLIVLLFDFSSMQPPDQTRAVKAATEFLNTRMTSSDLVSVMTFASTLKTVQDFTADRDRLLSVIQRFHVGEGSELSGMADTAPDAEDQSGSFVADDSEFNIFNADRKLAALQDAARTLGRYPQKKALVYLSSGIEKSGVDNQSQLRATQNTAVRANVAFYPIDVRGLSASAPGGDATQAGAFGTKLYSGAGQASLRDSFHNQQESLDSLASGTGGKALLDSNDLTSGFAQVQRDIRSYYVLSYATTNPAEDGRYRRLQVQLAPKLAATKARLEYRPGYYAPASFAKTTGADREAQLAQALAAENALVDLPIALEVDHFRLEKNKYFIPIAVTIPGSALAFRAKGSRQATELDFMAQVRDAKGQVVSTVRDTIPLKLDESSAGHVAQAQVEYSTGVALAPGRYQLRFVARENGNGKTGTFETGFNVPDLTSGGSLRLSSLILSNQVQSLNQAAGVKNAKKLLAQNPLVNPDGSELIPNVARAFRTGQYLSAYLELYDPSSPAGQGSGPAQVMADLAIYKGSQKIIETAPVRGIEAAKRAGVVSLRLGVAMTSLAPGEYDCQINVIDLAGKKFAFPRAHFAVYPPSTPHDPLPEGAPRSPARPSE